MRRDAMGEDLKTKDKAGLLLIEAAKWAGLICFLLYWISDKS